MDRAEHLLIADAARLETVSVKAFLRRMERKRIILANGPEDGRRKLVPVSALSPGAHEENGAGEDS